jgi:hypothetical protein
VSGLTFSLGLKLGKANNGLQGKTDTHFIMSASGTKRICALALCLLLDWNLMGQKRYFQRSADVDMKRRTRIDSLCQVDRFPV